MLTTRVSCFWSQLSVGHAKKQSIGQSTITVAVKKIVPMSMATLSEALQAVFKEVGEAVTSIVVLCGLIRKAEPEP